MNALAQVFAFGDRAVRVHGTADEPLFVAKDVCGCIEVPNVTDALSRLDNDEIDSIDLIDSIGRKQKVSAVTESGLYSLVMGSRKPEAKAFKRWVTHDVLPAIRKTGRFVDTEGSLYAGPVEPLRFAERVLACAAGYRDLLAKLGGVDAKDEFALRDMAALGIRKVRGSAPELPAAPEPKSVAEVLLDRGLTDLPAQPVGKRAKQLYKTRHFKAPKTMLQRIGGRPCPVSVYEAADLDLVNTAIDWYLGVLSRRSPVQPRLPHV